MRCFSRLGLSFVFAAVFFGGVASEQTSLAAADPGSATPATVTSAFRDGDRWCMVGDSITHSGTWHQWVTLYWQTRFPNRTIETFNAGISGDNAGGGLRRLEWDILVHKPTVVSVMFGMNDVMRTLYNDPNPTAETLARRRDRIETYKKNQRELVTKLKEAGARVILITPSAFDDTAEIDRPRQAGVNAALAECAEFLRELATEMNCGLVDLHAPMTKLAAQSQTKDPKFSLTRGDRVHPDLPGHLLMAYHFLKAQSAPSLVARVKIEMRLGAMVVDNGRVAGLRNVDGGVTFKWTASALPFPVDPSTAPALEWVPFQNELNREELQIVGLEAGQYELRIDDEAIRSYSADELARGVNLAVETSTPQYRQAQVVATLVAKRTQLVGGDLRGVAHIESYAAPTLGTPLTLEQMLPFIEKKQEDFKKSPAAASTMAAYEKYAARKARVADTRAEVERLARAAREAAVPREHVFEIVRRK